MTDWVLIFAAIASTYLQWQQNQIFKRQNDIFATQARQPMSTETAKGVRFKRYWPTIVMSLLILLVAFDIYDRHHPHYGSDPQSIYAWDDSRPLKRVYSRKFENETVVLDGKEFLNPTFDNVTFVFNGSGGVRILNATWVKHDGQLAVRIASRNRLVASTISLLTTFASAAGCNSAAVVMAPNTSVEGVTPPEK